MIKKRIYLEIESKRRELYSRVYFSILAAKKNFSVVISKKSRLYENLRGNLQQGHVILKSASRGSEQTIKFLKKNHHKIYAFDEEGALLVNKLDTSERVTNNCVENLQNFFCWGEKEYFFIKNRKKKIENNNLIITGNSRIELLKKKNLHIYQSEINNIKNQYGKFNLYLTSFHRYNSVNDNVSFLDKEKFQVKNSYNIKNKDEILKLRKRVIEIQKKNFQKTLEFFRVYEKNKIEIPLVIRPHPAENLEVYENVIKNFKNIKICFDHSNTNAWILASEKVISCNCTAQVEAFLVNKTSINLMFYNDKSIELEEVMMCSLNVNKINDALKLLKLSQNKINNKINKKLVLKKLQKTFYNLKTSSCSVENILKVLISNNKFTYLNKDKKVGFFYYYYFIIKNYLKNKILYFSQSKIEKKRNIQKMDGIFLNEIVKIIEEISKKDLFKLKVVELYPGVICIQMRE